MKKLLASALALSLIPVSAHAAEVVGVYANHGQCNSAWSQAGKEVRKSSGTTVYWCEQVAGVWILFKA
jgi:hypothetical protein